MKMTGEQRIAAPRMRVWQALNDPDVLKQCIPGCQSLEKESEERLKATIAIKIGPIGARFTGVVTLSDLDPPNSYTISGEGQGGAAGSAKGGAKVRLQDDADATLLLYDVDAQVGGRLAQLGGPVIDATAKQLAGSFFKRFGDLVAAAAAPEAAAGPPLQEPPGPAPAAPDPTFAKTAAAPGSALPKRATILWTLAVAAAALAGFVVGRG